LLLESAQALDEAKGQPPGGDGAAGSTAESPLARLARFNGVEFVISVPADGQKFDSWSAENPEQISQWVRQTSQQFRTLGESFQAGQLNQLEGLGPQCHVALVSRANTDLCVGFHRSLSQDLVRDTMSKIVIQWAS
jgi:hypothetical protein